MFCTTLYVGQSVRVEVDGKFVATLTFRQKSGQRVSLHCETTPGTRVAKPDTVTDR